MFLVKFLTVKLLCIYLLCIYLHYIHICIYLLTTNKIEVSQKGPPLQNLIDLSAPPLQLEGQYLPRFPKKKHHSYQD